jgi:hypothetical protein
MEAAFMSCALNLSPFVACYELWKNMTIFKNVILTENSGNPETHPYEYYFLNSLFQIFDFQLTPEEMLQLNGLDLGENGRIINFLFWKG